jgi:hypothetical protein
MKTTQLEIVNPAYEILTQFSNEKSHVKVIHKECGTSFRIPVGNLRKKDFECPYCSGAVNRNNQWFRKKIHRAFAGKILIIGDYITKESKILFEYKLCSHQFLAKPKDILDEDKRASYKICSLCGPIKQSYNEIQLGKFISSILPDEDILLNYQGLLSSSKEIDIYIPKLKVAIEYDGVYFHSDHFSTNTEYQQLNKQLECSKLGVTLLPIFSDEYNHTAQKKKICQAKIKDFFRLREELQIDLEQSYISKLSNLEKEEFFNENHLCGNSKKNLVSYGLFYQGKLISAIAFSKYKTNHQLLIDRYTVSIDTYFPKAFTILWNYFIKDKSNLFWEKVYIEIDRRWKDIELPSEFEFLKCNPPRTFYVNNVQKLVRIPEEELTESKKKYAKVWDCGTELYSCSINKGKPNG